MFSEWGRARGHLASFDGTGLIVARAHDDSTCPAKPAQMISQSPALPARLGDSLFPRVAVTELPAAFFEDMWQVGDLPRGYCAPKAFVFDRRYQLGGP
jgi:hypothetical protein